MPDALFLLLLQREQKGTTHYTVILSPFLWYLEESTLSMVSLSSLLGVFHFFDTLIDNLASVDGTKYRSHTKPQDGAKVRNILC